MTDSSIAELSALTKMMLNIYLGKKNFSFFFLPLGYKLIDISMCEY